MSERFFGTDGLRGTVNAYPMTVDVALRLGLAAGVRFRRGGHPHMVVIGKDTRLSGYMFESALTAGLCAAGMHVIMTGPLPTPAISFLTRSMRAELGVVNSASHNLFMTTASSFSTPTAISCRIRSKMKFPGWCLTRTWRGPIPTRGISGAPQK